MKAVLLDLNIILDYLFKRAGHGEAAKVIGLCAQKSMAGFVCAHEITTLSYFLNKALKVRNEVTKTLDRILKMFQIIEINAEILNSALHSAVADFEDAVLEASAQAKNINYIVTRNMKDFRKSSVSAITPEELLAIHIESDVK
ncbi:MAG: PIN domain-containing protein [Candidatus Margulisbacteria bacterium]|jgi:predicted nucleic acid-binding protein|nr:PIN domain-containing protein [Candidatus Margulisiibacteriota bacterium]